MIRRDDSGDWLIIKQDEHARLAADVARVWWPGGLQSIPWVVERLGIILAAWRSGHSVFDWNFGANWAEPLPYGLPLSPDVLVWFGVALHDRGWRKWDRAPRIDPKTGIPRSFLEMSMRDATVIWTESIAACLSIPLAGFSISQHFCHLAEQVRDGGRHDSDDCDAVERFLGEQAGVQAMFAERARMRGCAENYNRNRELGFRTVQFFDRVSLWLCCAEQHESAQMTGPHGEKVTFIPQSATVEDDSPSSVFRMRISRPDYRSWRVAIDPYPLSVESHELRTDAKRIPARRYSDDADLQATLNAAPAVELSWQIGPA